MTTPAKVGNQRVPMRSQMRAERSTMRLLVGGTNSAVAVATGVTSQEELRQAGAHVVLPDLADAAGFVAIVRDLTGRELAAV